MVKKTALDSQRLLQKVQTMRIIASSLPASKFDLYEKLKKDEKVKSRVTIDDRLNDLISLGFVKEGRCPTCNHKVFEIYPWQKLSNGETFFVLLNGRLDDFLFEIALLDRIEWRIKEKEPLMKGKVTKRKLTVVHRRQSVSPPVK